MKQSSLLPTDADSAVLDDVVGYLNFSSGARDARFLRNINELFRSIEGRAGREPAVDVLRQWLLRAIDRLEQAGGAFANASQARSVVQIATDPLLKAYREFHRDLLHHQDAADLWRPFFLGEACETVLAQGPPWNEPERIVAGAIGLLNDYVGYRPTATLESGSRSEPYPHEYVRPISLYVKGAGVAAGRYEAIISRALEILRAAEPDVLARAWFDLERLDEIALDPRAYDFDHPVNRRPNYHFGQWDPHQISPQGYYSRFVLQQITLDALLTRCAACESSGSHHASANPSPSRGGEQNEPACEKLEEAAAVLAGTILMASGTSGDAPGRHDSTVTLSTLLPQIAAYRDDFYKQLLAKETGPHGDRLRDEAQRTRQPFGGARQHLNHELARRRALQLQHVHLALLFARMGRPESALRQADEVRVASARMLTAIYCRLTSGHDALDRDELEPVVDDLEKVVELLHRAIECGALVDPWNVVGFAANFSLFTALENTVHDWRVDELIELVEQILDLAARAWSEAAAVDNGVLEERFSAILARLAAWWDRFATASVEGVKHLVAKEIEVSANLVAGALNAWHKAGAAAGDVAFWRLFVDQFDSSKAFQLVIEALLDHGDTVAARALMMQWVNQRDRTPLDAGDISFHPLAFQWLATIEAQQHASGDDRWPEVAMFFAYLEANAEEYWQAPTLRLAGMPAAGDDDDIPFGDPDNDEDDDEFDYDYEYDDELADDELADDDLDNGDESEFEDAPSEALAADEDDDDDDDDDDRKNGLFGAAYEGVNYRDSTDDGVEGDLADDGVEPLQSEWEVEAERLEQRLSFLNTIARLWKHAAITWGGAVEEPERREVLDQWLAQAGRNFRQLLELLDAVHGFRFRQPSRSHDSLVEYDRVRTIKDTLIQKIIATCVETATAARLLMTTRDDAGDAARFGEPVDNASVNLLRSVLAGDPQGVRAQWNGFLETLAGRPMLYVPHSRGGEPRQVVVTRSWQRLLSDLLGWLPKLGLIHETCELLALAQQLETDNPVGQGAVTEFDTLFENGYQAIVRAVVESAELWNSGGRRGATKGDADHLLVDVLQQLTEHQLDRWLAHSRTLRLSVVERLSSEDDWARFVKFVERYGGELFTQKFLSLGNLRGILHQTPDAWLKNLTDDPYAEDQLQLVAELDDKWPRGDAVELLSIAIEAVVENYRAYRDYNTTTTQSDHGELLYQFIDFLRQRAAYDRVAWNLKPVVWAHEILVRHGREAAAEMWRQAFAERTSDAADLHLKRLAALAAEYGMQLPTISDRLSERFVRPLVIDRLRAMVEPSMNGDGRKSRAAFAALEAEITELAGEPHGAGLDVPDWLAALEDEVTSARSRLNHVSSTDRLSRRIGQVRLSWSEILEQLGEDG